jgi:hypothetical protein
MRARTKPYRYAMDSPRPRNTRGKHHPLWTPNRSLIRYVSPTVFAVFDPSSGECVAVKELWPGTYYPKHKDSADYVSRETFTLPLWERRIP